MNKRAFNFVVRVAEILCLLGLTGASGYAQFKMITRDTSDGAIAFSFDDSADVLTSNAATPCNTLSLAQLGVVQACQFRITLSGIDPIQSLSTISTKSFVVVATVMGPSANQRNTIPFEIPITGSEPISCTPNIPINKTTFFVAFKSREQTVTFDSTPGRATITRILPPDDIRRLQQLIDDPLIGPANLRMGIRLRTVSGGFTFREFNVFFSSALDAAVSANTSSSNIVTVTAQITNDGQISQSPIEFLSSLPPQLAAEPGSCTATVDGSNIGTCAIKGSNIGFTLPFDESNALAPGKTVIITYQARVANNTPPCTELCIKSTTSHSCQFDKTCITTSCPPHQMCTQSQGFWKNHANAWPLRSLTLGNQTYNQAQLLNLLDTPIRGDASLILAGQLIAAKLNIANGADDTAIAATVARADNLLSNFAGKLPYNISLSTERGQNAINLANTLEQYNEGKLAGGPSSCK